MTNGSQDSVRIEVLYLEHCPNYPPTLALVRDVVAELGINVCVVPVEVKDSADAERCLFLGSPTVRVNGVDVECSARNRTDYGWGCRRYGGAGVPPREMIVTAMREQLWRASEERHSASGQDGAVP